MKAEDKRENMKINKDILKQAKEKGLSVGEVKLKVPHTQKVAIDMSDLMLNPGSPIHCDKCHERMGVFHTLRYALFHKQGDVYFVPCKGCGTVNRRVKGLYKSEINQKWKDFEKGK